MGALLLASTSLHAGIRADDLYPLPNADFSSGLTSWTQTSSDGSLAFSASGGPLGLTPSARADVAPQVTAVLEQTHPVGDPTLPPITPAIGAPGEKLELAARVFLGGNTGAVWLEAVATTPSGSLPFARSSLLRASAAPTGTWLWLSSEPLAGGDARIPADAAEVTLRLHVDGAGPVWFDRVPCGRFEYSAWELAGADFEGGGIDPAWTTSGRVRASVPGVETDAYYGEGYLVLEGSGNAAARQALPIAGDPGTPTPGKLPEAGAWLYAEPSAPSPGADSLLEVRLGVYAWDAGAPWSTAELLSLGAWTDATDDAGRWVWLEALPIGAGGLPLDRSHVVVEVEKRGPGSVRADFVQIGERFGVDGNPARHVTANYLGPFRSPLAAEAQTTPPTPQEIWRNWAWTAAPHCDRSFTAFFHQPDCAASPDCFRANLRRDGAASVEGSLDDLPLVGAYDSRDRDVIRYHVALARAIGLDSFTYLHQGHTLAQQSASFGLEPLNAQAYAALLDVAEEPDLNFKVALMYEPKVHFNGWVQGEPTLADKKAGIEADLVQLVDQTRARKSALRRDGRLVVYLFRNDVCAPGGSPCLSDADWAEMRAVVEAATGSELLLVADVPSTSAGVFDGLSRWDLVSLPMLAYRTWTQVASGQPASPPPGPAAARAHADKVNAVAATWAAVDDSSRLAVAIAWPGFDDSGVGGWGAPNLDGTDGAPLCVRIAPDHDGDFFQATLDGALESGADWIQVATWNDWNEQTRVEPRWRREYQLPVLQGQTPDASAVAAVFDRALLLQARVAEFKGLELGVDLLPGALQVVADDYLVRAHTLPGVVEYD